MKGILIDNTVITATIMKIHLKSIGMTDTAATAILAPNDKQDVVLMIQLLNSILQLPPAGQTDNPNTFASRRILILLGHLYCHLLEAYMHSSLSLHEQLVRVSAAAHLVLALYSWNKGDFIPIQLYFDVMSMVKNIYFCVAKTQIDNPEGQFWIILLGTDGLEKVFGKVRTMIGSDHHADQLQLTNQIDGAVQCVKILELHPEWGVQSRHITVKSLEEQGNDISKKLDHLNPRSWTGDVHVKNVILRSCWQEGHHLAEKELTEASIDIPFREMETGEGFDILCPFGGSQIVLINGAIVAGEAEETEEERDEVALDVPSLAISSAAADDDAMMPDIEDIAGSEDAAADPSRKVEAWVPVGASPGNTGKPQHKSTIL